MRATLTLTFAVLWVAASATAQMSFQARVDKLEAAFEDELQLRLEVSVADPSVTTTPITPPEMIAFHVGGSGSSVARQGDLTLRSYTFMLRPRQSGEVTIPSFKVEFRRADGVDTLSSEPIIVRIAAPKPVPKSGAMPWTLIVGLLIVFVLSSAGYVWYRRRAVRNVIAESDWRDDIRAQYGEIRKLAEREDFRSFSTQVLRLVLGAIERVHSARLTGYTSTDVLRWMEEQALDGELRGLCRSLFEFCEEVKFSTGRVEPQSARAAVAAADKIVELLTK